MSVLAIAVSSLLFVLANMMAESVYPEFLNSAAYLAEQEFERISSKRFSEALPEGPNHYTGDFSEYRYQISISPVPAELGNDPEMERYKQVQIAVDHSRAGGVILTTLVTDH